MDGQMGVWGSGGVYGEGIGGVLWKWVGNGGWADGWVGVYGGGGQMGVGGLGKQMGVQGGLWGSKGDGWTEQGL